MGDVGDGDGRAVPTKHVPAGFPGWFSRQRLPSAHSAALLKSEFGLGGHIRMADLASSPQWAFRHKGGRRHCYIASKHQPTR